MPKLVDHNERRSYIALVAAGAIAELGLEGTTIREIASRSGYSKGIVEHYFNGREDIIEAALEQMNARYLAREDEQASGRQGIEALRARMGCILPLNAELRQEWKIRLCFWSVAAIDSEAGKAQRRRLKLTRQRFLYDLETAQQLGELTPEIEPGKAAVKLSLFLFGVACGALLDPRYYNKNYLLTLIDETLDQLMNGARP